MRFRKVIIQMNSKKNSKKEVLKDESPNLKIQPVAETSPGKRDHHLYGDQTKKSIPHSGQENIPNDEHEEEANKLKRTSKII